MVDRLVTDANVGIPNRNVPADYQSSDNFVEIAHDLLTNTDYGSGNIVGHDGVDRISMIEGAKYCRANGFFWNGVIDSKFNLSKATAGFKNGLLQIIIPFAKGSEPKTLKIS